MEQKELQTLVGMWPMAMNDDNLWGDFDRLMRFSFRVSPAGSSLSGPTTELYFKLNRHTGDPTPLSKEEFERACVSAYLSGAGSSARRDIPL